MSQKTVNVQKMDWYQVEDGEERAKTQIQVGMLVTEDTPVDGNILIPCPVAGLAMPAQVHLADNEPRPNDGAMWGVDADNAENYIYEVGKIVQRVQTLQGYKYKIWVRNDTGTPLTLAKGDRLKPSTTTPGHFEVVTVDEATLAGVVDLKNSPFIYTNTGEDVAATSSSFVLVERA